MTSLSCVRWCGSTHGYVAKRMAGDSILVPTAFRRRAPPRAALVSEASAILMRDLRRDSSGNGVILTEGGVSVVVALYVQAASLSVAAMPGYVERLIAVLLAIVLTDFGAA